MLDILSEISKNYGPKHFGTGIKKNKDLYVWVLENTKTWPELPLSQKGYILLKNLDPICQISNKNKRWNSTKQEFSFCGMTGKCQCAKITISKKISTDKNGYSEEKKKQIQTDRENTNLLLYGVKNAGQTSEAKSAHKALYEDETKVALIIAGMQSTCLTNLGEINPMKVDSIKAKAITTNLLRYGKKNVMQVAEFVEKCLKTKKERYLPHRLAKQNYKQFVSNILRIYQLDVLSPTKDEYIGVQCRPNCTFKCVVCNDIFEKRFDYASPPRCMICYPSDPKFKSNEELELLTFIESICNKKILSGDRRIINPFELDIVIPELKIAIEYCGLYWHSENSSKEKGLKRGFNYHANKFIYCASKGYTLITIFSDEWLHKKHIIKSMLLNLFTQTESVYARKCKIVEVTREKANAFYEQNHLIGSRYILPITYGLQVDNELLACMSFAKENNEYNLVRYCTSKRVVGGASKLLSHFIKEYKPKSIISFSDNRFSIGNLYNVLGFKKCGVVPPMQYYVENHLIKYQKRELSIKWIKKNAPYLNFIKPSGERKTEWELLQELGYDRIWDCGKVKWRITL
jgi:hypothetical protein